MKRVKREECDVTGTNVKREREREKESFMHLIPRRQSAHANEEGMQKKCRVVRADSLAVQPY